MALGRISLFIQRLAKEPPFRVFVAALVKILPTSIRTRSEWDAVARPHYLMGVLKAAEQAIREGQREISVIEFGVAGGEGLLALQEYAASVERETGVKILVYGFDTGKGLPTVKTNYRDHPDQWRSGDYAMDEQWLRRQLAPRTTLVLGEIDQTLPRFVRETQKASIGFIAVDVDLYSSAKEVLRFYLLPERRILRRVAMYFDDTHFFFNHRYAGELLAIEEFDQESSAVKIDRWRGIANGRPFPESPWLQCMYLAHDLDAISKVALERPPAEIN